MMTILAESYFHTLDPFAIQITETFGLRWYGLAYAVGFLVFWLFVRWMAKRGRTPLTVQAAGDLMFYLILGVLLGGRLGWALFYQPEVFIGFSKSFPFWDLLAINTGGLSSHGGMVGVIFAVWLFSRRHTVSMLNILDMVVLGCTPGLCFGRLANFVNAELWGRPLPYSIQADPPGWSVKFSEEITHVGFAQVAE
ncbi:MAG: prolipoprotein diacylglyceryl transferase, partial [Gemmatimonadota bacterium]